MQTDSSVVWFSPFSTVQLSGGRVRYVETHCIISIININEREPTVTAHNYWNSVVYDLLNVNKRVQHTLAQSLMSFEQGTNEWRYSF